MGRRLKIVREIRDITQPALAAAIGFSTTALSAWESGRNRIDVVGLGRIMQVLGCTADYIVAGDKGGLRFDLARLVQSREESEPLDIASRRGRPKRKKALSD